MKEITTTVYETDDGRRFTTEVAAKAHEQWLRDREDKTTYWRVLAGPDLTEGKGYYKRYHLAVYIPDRFAPSPERWVEDWAHRAFGRPLSFVMGVAPMETWRCMPISREEYLTTPPRSQFLTEIFEQISLTPGANEAGLVVEEVADRG